MLFPAITVTPSTPLSFDLSRLSGPGVRVSSISVHNTTGGGALYYGLSDFAPGTKVGGLFTDNFTGKSTIPYGRPQVENFSPSSDPTANTSGFGLASVMPGWTFSDASDASDDGNMVVSNLDGVITFAAAFSGNHSSVTTPRISQPLLSSANGIPVEAGATVRLEAGYLDYKLSRWFGLVVASATTATVRLQITLA